MNQHKHIHWGILVAVSIFVGFFLVGQINITYNTDKAEAAGSLLQTSDITCAGVFITPGVSDQGGSRYPVAMRYENGSRHYFIFAGDKHVYEFPEPTLMPCNTPLTSVNRATMESWGGDWGSFTVNGSPGSTPFQNSSVVGMGLSYDSVLSELILNWSNTYSLAPPHNSFAAMTLNNSTHTFSNVGCWALTGVIQSQAAGGVLSIPNSFVSANLPAGARWGVGYGGPLGSYVGVSLGPTLFAVPPPAPNPCTPNTDTFIGSGTVLAQYGQNPVGPTCSVLGLGCTPTQAPTAPYPAKLGLNTYSKSMYEPDWDPWQGHGWFGFNSTFSMGWYDDGAKQGIVVPILAPEGWANTTVLASPAPTIDNSGFYQTGVFYVPSTSTHDGLNINTGDLIWVKTCRFGVDPGCDSNANGRDFSFMVVDSVNPSTGKIAYHNLNSDFGSGDHKPIVGGEVLDGCIYMHGEPSCSRGVFLLQIYDPAQYAQVIAGTRQPYDVSYNQEIDMSSLVPGFGCPNCGHGVNYGYLGTETYPPVSTITDPLAHQMMIAFKNGNNPLYQVSDAIYVFNVGPNAVTPPTASPGTPPPAPAPAPSPSPSPTPSPTPTPTPPSSGAPCTLVTSGTDALGHVWTFGPTSSTSGWTLRDGDYSLPGGGNKAGAHGPYYKFINGIVNVFDDRYNNWYHWNESTKDWVLVGATEPACTSAPLAGDLNADGIVNSLDWSIMSIVWFTSNANADLNHDGIVNSIDFSILNRNWFKSN
ncbi:MAG: dockerin type I repeat-containing protein [Patescibacteria group bacterium]